MSTSYIPIQSPAKIRALPTRAPYHHAIFSHHTLLQPPEKAGITGRITGKNRSRRFPIPPHAHRLQPICPTFKKCQSPPPGRISGFGGYMSC